MPCRQVSLSLTHTQTHTLSLALSLSLSDTHTHTLSLSHTHTQHTHTLTHTHCLSLSHTHTRHTHTVSQRRPRGRHAQARDRRCPCTLYPVPCTLHPAPRILTPHPAPCTLALYIYLPSNPEHQIRHVQARGRGRRMHAVQGWHLLIQHRGILPWHMRGLPRPLPLAHRVPKHHQLHLPRGALWP